LSHFEPPKFNIALLHMYDNAVAFGSRAANEISTF